MYVTGGCTGGPPAGGCTTPDTVMNRLCLRCRQSLALILGIAPLTTTQANANGDTIWLIGWVQA